MKRWLIYGYGTAARRILAAAQKHPHYRAEAVVVGGRDASKARALAQEFGAECRPFALEQASAHLADVELVLHCAGPFAHTSQPMLEACLATGTHYLDITGELAVFRACHQQHREAAKAGIVVLPGVGMDVVPTDCLMTALAEQMPDAVEISLALLKSGSARSAGTLKTALEGIAAGNFVIEDGELCPAPLGHRRRKVEVAGVSYALASIPLGEVYTGFWSTGIPNVTVYGAVPGAAVFFGRMARPLLRTRAGLRFAQRVVDWLRPAPPKKQTDEGSLFWAEAKNRQGRTLQGTFTGPSGAVLTAHAAAHSVFEVLSGRVRPGATTAGRAFGSSFAERWGQIELLPQPRSTPQPLAEAAITS